MIKKFIKDLKQNSSFIIISLPAILLLFAFSYLPMFGVTLAFMDYYPSKGFFKSPWTGLTNFKFFFTSQDAFRVTRNTVGLNLCFIVLGLLFSVTIAIMLYQLGKRTTKFIQTSMFIPYFTSWVVVSYVLYAFLNPQLGVLNQIIKAFGGETKLWYSEPSLWPVIMILCYLWKNIGYLSVIYYAGLMGIDESYYEAARIDGASSIQQIFKITIPLLSPLMILLVLTQVGQIMRADFGMFYFLPKDSGALYSTTDVIDTYVFRALRVTGDIGMSSAVGLYQSFVGFILVVASNWIVKKIEPEKAIF